MRGSFFIPTFLEQIFLKSNAHNDKILIDERVYCIYRKENGLMQKRVEPVRYIIYIDKIWLMDFVTGTYLLFLVRQTYGLQSGLFRLLASAAAGASVFVALLLLPGIGLIPKLLLQAVCVNLLVLKAAFSFRTKEMVVKAYACMNGYGLLMGGMLYCLSGYLPLVRENLTLESVLFVTTATALLAGLYLYLWKKSRKPDRLYTVKLDFYGEAYFCKGLADSGNSLHEPYGGRPVSILEKRAVGNLVGRVPPEKRYLVPYRSIGKKHGLLEAAELPFMEVDDGEQKKAFHKVVVAFSDEALTGKRDYQAILHPKFVRWEE